MKFSTCVSATALLAVTAVEAQPYRLYVVTSRSPFTEQRIWFGDGLAYIGPSVPANVRSAVNVTLTLERRDLLFVDTDTTTSPPSTPKLPSPTFLVANTRAGAQGPLFLAHSATSLGSDDVYIWAGFFGLMYPTSHSVPAGSGALALLPVEGSPGTYSVRYDPVGETVEQRIGVKGGMTGSLYVHDGWRD